jgi:hypothetical protein
MYPAVLPMVDHDVATGPDAEFVQAIDNFGEQLFSDFPWRLQREA